MRYSQLATVAGLIAMAAAAPVNADSAALKARSPVFGVGPAANVGTAKYIDRNMRKNKNNVKVYETTVKNTGKPPKTSSSKPKPAPKKGKRDVEEEADEEGTALEARSPVFGVGPAANVGTAKYIDRNMRKNKNNVKVYETTVKNTGKPPKTSSSKPKPKPAPKKGKRDVEEEADEEEADEEGAALEARSPVFGVGPAANVGTAKYIDRNMRKNKNNVKVYETTVKNTGKPPKTSSSKPKPAPKKGKRDVDAEEEAEE